MCCENTYDKPNLVAVGLMNLFKNSLNAEHLQGRFSGDTYYSSHKTFHSAGTGRVIMLTQPGPVNA